jgi:hypothetical protein
MEQSAYGTHLENANTLSVEMMLKVKDIPHGYHVYDSLLHNLFHLLLVPDGTNLLRYGT